MSEALALVEGAARSPRALEGPPLHRLRLALGQRSPRALECLAPQTVQTDLVRSTHAGMR